MCDIAKALSRAFTPPGTGGIEAQLEAATQEAKQQADIAAAGPQSSEAAQMAQEARLRLLLAATGSSATFAGGGSATPNVGTKALTGN